MKKNQKNDEQYIKNPSEPDEKADELNENGPTSEKRTDSIIETGSIIASNGKYTIHCLTIIGQIEGHYILSSQNKTTKYEHVILKNQRQGASCYERITKKIHFFCNIVQRFAF